MNHPELMIMLAAHATQLTERPADAAALLVDAAAMLTCEAKMDPVELTERLTRSHATLIAAEEAVNQFGATAARKQ